MKDISSFRETKTVLSYIKYHIVFCTRYRRKIFTTSYKRKKTRDLITSICEENSVTIYMLEINKEYINIIVECPPDISPNQLVFRIKQKCNVVIHRQKTIPNLWTRSCLISTETLQDEIINNYILSQKHRD